MRGSLGATTRRAIAFVGARPACFQLPPASVDRYTPLPQLTELRSFPSPVATHTTLESDGATAMSPMDATASCSNTGDQVMPLSSVFMMPPVPSPT